MHSTSPRSYMVHYDRENTRKKLFENYYCDFPLDSIDWHRIITIGATNTRY